MYSSGFFLRKKKKKFLFFSNIQICTIFHLSSFFLTRRRMCHDTLLISFQFFRSCRSPPSFLSLEKTRRVHGGSPSIRDIVHPFSRISVNLDRLPLPPLSLFFSSSFHASREWRRAVIPPSRLQRRWWVCFTNSFHEDVPSRPCRIIYVTAN